MKIRNIFVDALEKLVFITHFTEYTSAHPVYQQILNTEPNNFRIPTIHESAIMARRILRLESISTISTIFPSESSDHRRPDSVNAKPFGLMEYYADCEDSGNPTLLAMPIASSFRNIASGSNMTMSFQWHPPVDHPYSAAEMPRFSLMGYLEDISPSDKEALKLEICYSKTHPDSVFWMPGNKIHTSYWARMIVKEIYWLGGFGDRAYIGWIPLEEFQSITQNEINKLRLPGENSE